MTLRPVVTSILVMSGNDSRDRQSLRSILIQNGTFEHEIVIYGDESGEFVNFAKNLAQRKERPLFYSNENFEEALSLVRGEYAHILLAPDYLAAPMILERRVEFMKYNTECQMCFSDARFIDQRTGEACDSPVTLILKQAGCGNAFEIPSPMLTSAFFFRSAIFGLLDGYQRMLLLGTSMLAIWMDGSFQTSYIPAREITHYLAWDKGVDGYAQ